MVGRAIPVWVGERLFESKLEAENEIKRIWNSYEIGQDVTDPDDIQFLGGRLSTVAWWSREGPAERWRVGDSHNGRDEADLMREDIDPNSCVGTVGVSVRHTFTPRKR